MRLYENPVMAEQIVRDAEDRRVKKQPRAPGIHASDLIRCLKQSWITRQRGLQGQIDSFGVDVLTTFLTGHGYHALLEQGQAEIEVVLPLLNGNAATCTIDYMLPNDIRPWEVKSTRYSAKKTPIELAHYIDQIGTYCLTQRSLSGCLVVLFLNGDYAQNRRPILKVWEVEFTNEELVSWLIELNRRYEIIAGDEMPEGDFEHYDWECQYCPYGPKVGTGECPGGIPRMTPFFLPEDDNFEPVEIIEL